MTGRRALSLLLLALLAWPALPAEAQSLSQVFASCCASHVVGVRSPSCAHDVD